MAENIYTKLGLIQQELKAPKSLNNTFGGYKYRSNESILEALKPLLLKHKCTLFQSDDFVMHGDRFHVKATSTLVCLESDSKIGAHGFAREALNKKGMDDSQITGACSSYARKYSLNGLFLIDDNKDADTDQYQNQQTNNCGLEDEARDLYDKVKAKMSSEAAQWAYDLISKKKYQDAIKYMNGGK